MYSKIRSTYDRLKEAHYGKYRHKDLGLPEPSTSIDIIVIIPIFAEKEVSRTLNSLMACTNKALAIEVILLINESEDVADVHRQVNEDCYRNVLEDIESKNLPIIFHLMYITDIPKKIAGVGTARKLAMDAAADRFKKISKLEKGIIANLDADCLVSENYFEAILDHFETKPKDELVSIAFKHRLDEIENPTQKDAIRQYEDYLHYFIRMQKKLGLPYAFQTIGSAFAVRAKAYFQVGGMNRRKAGEDFYFIHKFTKKGSISELNACKVYPSGRASFRVPFGTGKAVADMLNGIPVYYAYHPQSFYDLELLVQGVEDLYSANNDDFLSRLPKGLREYLNSQNFQTTIDKLQRNTTSASSFSKAFYQWFDAFRLMKYLHFVRDQYYPSLPIDEIEKELRGNTKTVEHKIHWQ